jgi:hypothetical protein
VKDIRKRFQSGLSGLLFGGFWGGIVGAIAFGLLTFFDDTAYLWGAAQNWIWLFMIFGLIWGWVVGGILGAIIGAMQADRRTGIIIGVVAGLLIAIRLVYDGGIDTFVFVVIVICSMLGWFIASTLRARDSLR